MYVQPVQQPQHTFAWEQGRATIQPTGAVTTTPHGYPVPGQPAMYLPQQVSFQYYQKLNSYTEAEWRLLSVNISCIE